MEHRLRLGQLLVDATIISQEQLDDVLRMQKQDGRKLGTLLVERELINETQLTQILSQQLSVPWVSLYHVDFSRRLLSLVPREVAEKFCLVPIYVRHVRGQGDTLYVAMDDPTNDEALKACSMWAGLPTRAMISSPSDIRNAIRVYYPDARRASVPPTTQAQQSATPLATGEASPSDVSAVASASSEASDDPSKSQQPSDDTSTSEQASGDTSAAQQAPEAPSASEPQTPNSLAMEAGTSGVDEPSPPQPTPPVAPREPSIPPEPEAAAAWTPAAVVAESANVQSLSPERAEQPSADAASAPAQDPKDRAVPEPGGEQPAPEAAADGPAALSEESAESESEGHARSLDPGTLDPNADTSSSVSVGSLPPPAIDEQVTLEVGAEISLEEVLPEGKSMPRRRPMTGAERLMSLTLLDGTTLSLPVRRLAAKRRAAVTMVQESRQSDESESAAESAQPAAEPSLPTATPSSRPPPPPSSRGPSSQRPARLSQPPAEIVPTTDFSARDVVAALRAAAHGVDPTDILGVEPKWQAILAALLSLMLRKGLIDEKEFVDELKKV